MDVHELGVLVRRERESSGERARVAAECAAREPRARRVLVDDVRLHVAERRRVPGRNADVVEPRRDDVVQRRELVRRFGSRAVRTWRTRTETERRAARRDGRALAWVDERAEADDADGAVTL